MTKETILSRAFGAINGLYMGSELTIGTYRFLENNFNYRPEMHLAALAMGIVSYYTVYKTSSLGVAAWVKDKDQAAPPPLSNTPTQTP